MNFIDLKSFLDEKSEQYNSADFISSDPVSVPHMFTRKEDIEISAFLTSLISWGRRPMIIRSAVELMQRLDLEPYKFIMQATDRELTGISAGFRYRTFNEDDCLYFLRCLRFIYSDHGDMENLFTKQLKFSEEGYGKVLAEFRKAFVSAYPPGRSGKHFPDVEKKSSAKRLCMFMRWMVRNDERGVDFGVWKSVPVSILHCPLDVHSGRVARKLGLLSRTQDDWQAVCELTGNLRKLDSKDPVRYDYALFGLGIFEKF